MKPQVASNGHDKSVAFLPTTKQVNYRFSIVRPEDCPGIWGTVGEMLRPAVERSDGRWTLEHLFDYIYKGGQTLWVGFNDENTIKCAMTTQIVAYPNSKMLAIQFLGGTDYENWSDDMLNTVTDYGKDAGCSGVEAVARFGFWPLFKRNGFGRSYVTYEKLFGDSQ